MIFPFFYETKADHTMSLWNVCAMLAARFFLRLCSILCFLDFPALSLGRFGYHPSQNKDHQIPDDHMGVLRTWKDTSSQYLISSTWEGEAFVSILAII